VNDILIIGAGMGGLTLALELHQRKIACRVFESILEEEVQRAAQMRADAAAVLLAAWGVFVWLNRAAEQLEPDAMRQAKREDRKIEKAAKGDDKR
jgi:2-polyprenyl-6-methoxyphenol hydroxylase-like FAD-dependent oxidoreductase